MTDFLVYDAKVAVLITVFYMFYRLLLSKETFHRVNRVVLLATAMLSFVLPLCVFTLHKTVTIDAMPMVSVGDVQMEIAEDEEPMAWLIALPILYMVGMLMTLGHTLLSVWKVMLLIRRGEQHPQPDGTILCVTANAGVLPFSWMHYIVMNRADYEAHDAAILTHERGHIRLHHSWDVLLVDLLTALQWFNPAMWMLRQDLRAIHEYEADGAVLSQGINARQYQYLLISKATGIGYTEVAHARPFELVRWISLNRNIGGYSIANGISHSTLKNRITMMLHKKSQSSSLLKLLALLPIVGITLALNAETVNDYVYQQPQKKIIKKGKKNATAQVGNHVIDIISDTVSNVRIDNPSIERVVVKGDKEPMVLLDGYRISNETLSKIEPEIIASITVLKDQRAIDLYGEEGRNGVVLVTTKNGVKEISVPVEQDEQAFDVVEKMPEYPGGPQALLEYLAKNIRYPEAAEKAGQQGRVIATFVVMKDGSISHAKIVKSISPELDEEALRVLNAMPNWKPGMQSGQAVNVKYTVPISFALPDQKVEQTKESKVVVVGGIK